MRGLERIAAAFYAAQVQNRAALMPYFTLGFPDSETSAEVIQAIAAAGADLIELGIPFSDPLADGPSIQHSTQVALEHGMATAKCLKMVRELRQRGVTQPFLLMGYTNPILAFGVEDFVREATQAGADGLIVPDLPVEEAKFIESACARVGLALIYLAAPTTTDERLAYVASHTTGFLYIVSLTGVTGARSRVWEGLEALLGRARAVTKQPLVVGFGISTPAQAAEVGRMAEGVIVGSALIDAAEIAADPVQAAGGFVRALREAMRKRTAPSARSDPLEVQD
jgi:tryptophan synthase alpha chain